MFKFYARDGIEPPHVHVVGNGGTAKVWLSPTVVEEDMRGYDEHQMNRILGIVREHHDEWLSVWRSFFGR